MAKNDLSKLTEKNRADKDDISKVDTSVPGPSGDVTGAPLEGNVREDSGVLLKEGATTPVDKLIDDVQHRESGPLGAANDASREAKETLLATEGGSLSDSNEALKDRIADKLEDQGAESTKANISEELGNPGLEDDNVERRDPSRTVQRPDGTITTADRPDETAHYIGGNRVMITDEQKAKVDSLLKAIDDTADGRSVGDIPTSDSYWERKKELDAFIARLKR